MDSLQEGIVRFNNNDYLTNKELFQKISNSHTPHTLFIGCADSRVVPNLITNTLPGELFVVRNIANIVPPYRQTDEFVATTSAIEYAVQVLNVENIVVCGHSNCGGCSSLMKNEEELNEVPHVKKWLELGRDVKEKVLRKGKNTSSEELEWMAEQINIVEQIKHLLTYPFIVDKYINGKLKIHGWYYVIASGAVYNYNKDTGFFELIQ